MNTKKLLALLLCLAMALGLFTACGSKEEAASSETTAEATTIKIGYLGPLTGGVAQYGIAVQTGAKLYINKLNAAGGINGKQVELVSYDDEGDQAKALLGYADLMDKGVVAIIGDVTTGPTVALAAESYNDGTPVITASATSEAVTYNAETNTVYSNVFRSCFIDPFQGTTMANFAKDECDAKTAAVLYDYGDTYSKGVYENFVKQCKEIGIEVVAEEKYASGAIDFAGQLSNIKAQNPDVLFLPVYYNDVALIVKQAKEAGLETQYLGVDGWSSVLAEISDPALIEGAYYCSGYSPENTSELVQQFLKEYKEAYPSADTPNMFVAQSYDAAWILTDAIAKADAAGNLTNEEIIKNIKATDKDFVTGHVVYDDHNDPQKTASIIYISNGTESFWGTK